jgi:signal transduction histidine kinase
MIVLFIIAIGVVLLTQHFQKNLYIQRLQQEAIKAQHQQDLLRSSILVQEQERKRIAQDIHDELGAILSISRMQLIQLEGKEEFEKDQLKHSLQNVRSLTEKSLSSMRRISHELMPPQLEAFGLVKTLESMSHHAKGTNTIQIHIDAAESLPDMSWAITLGLYRICMEMINNTIKHANASHIHIHLQYEQDQFICHYQDDGKGIDPLVKSAGLGQKSMEGRASSLGGTINYPATASGFSATIAIPAQTGV